jgi:hypothetical protein
MFNIGPKEVGVQKRDTLHSRCGGEISAEKSDFLSRL